AAHEALGTERRVDAARVDRHLLQLVRDPRGHAVDGIHHVGVGDHPAAPIHEPAGPRLDEGRGLHGDGAGAAVERDLRVAARGVVDVLLRRHYTPTLGLNMWGYRGRVVGRKAPGERRVVMLGGSTVFGFGVSPTQTLTAYLEGRLRTARPGGGTVTVVNLGYVREGAWSFRATLADYAYLDYDVAVLYEGYNDLRHANRRVFRRDSPVFRLTGYFPILPLVLD